ncbi:RNA polymerase sigma-70 factor [Parapedobacter composti]|uniref:RNA polymerase sigma-70 factor n=1 Tax=Parapedobacter composti TaxID=623281 RepID=UPI00147D6907|nr:RNA polymerase sigma-70 factor [Parapedobacter composti]
MDYKNLTDNNLWDGCKKGDLRAYNELFNRYAPQLYDFGMRYLKDEERSQEIGIDIFLDIWQRRGEITIEKDISSYIFKAMHFRCIDYLRKKQMVYVDVEMMKDDNRFSAESTDYPMRYREANDSYQLALNTLHPKCRRVFQLSREENLSYNQIANQLEISRHTVERHISTALKRMRLFYHDYLTFLIAALLTGL